MATARQTLCSVNSPQPRRIAASVLGLRKRFGNTSILDDITFDVGEGETLVLLGASGSGKTTILRTIAGLEHPDHGRVFLHGRDVTRLPPRERGVGVIFQSYALFPRMTVDQNISYGLRIRRQSKHQISRTVDHLLELVRLTDHRRKYPSQLSGGQQQRVAIARTLAYKPEVLLFDEPFGALDAQTRTRLRSEIRALLRQVNVPAIFITHDQEEALELGDRIAVMNEGRIEQIGTPFEIYNHAATEHVAKFLGRANSLAGTFQEGMVDLGIGLVPLRHEQFQNGQRVKVIFRPEDVALRHGPVRSDIEFPLIGAIEEIGFMGSYRKILLKLNNGHQILVTRPTADRPLEDLEIGDQLSLQVTRFTVLSAEEYRSV